MSSGRGRWAAIVAVTAVALGIGGYAAYDASRSDDDEGAAAAPITPTPTVEAFPPATAAAPVLGALSDQAPAPTAEGLAAALAPWLDDPDLGSQVVASVVDVATGQPLFERQVQLAVTPASTTKLVTGFAALKVLGPGYQVSTRVVGGPQPGQVVLVGGGDVMLTTEQVPADAYPQRASLADLANRTVAALAAQGITSVQLTYDASLFGGPAVNPAWQPSYLTSGEVAPVTALMADKGKVDPDGVERVSDPALEAATRFASALTAAGVAVAEAPLPGVAPVDADVLAEVVSPTVAQMVETMLVESDDDVAEGLLRLVGTTSATPSTVEGSVPVVVDALGTSGVPVEGVTLRDGSGLARSNAIPARTLTSLLDVAAGADVLGSLAADLPVAGFTGTLDDRFDNDDDRAGAGVVRAKTGTLNGVSSLAGTVVSADGRLLAFAFMADQIPIESTLDARAAIDAAATTLARCGCR